MCTTGMSPVMSSYLFMGFPLRGKCKKASCKRRWLARMHHYVSQQHQLIGEISQNGINRSSLTESMEQQAAKGNL